MKADERRRRLSELANTTLGWVGGVAEGRVPRLALCRCGRGFYTTQTARKFCSTACAVASAKVARAAKVARPASTCRRCGDQLPVVCPCCAAELGLGAESILDVEFGAD